MPSLAGLWGEVRFALRLLRLNAWFTSAAVLPLALAIACAAAVLTLADAALFRATGVRDPGRVAAVYTFSRSQGRYLSDSYPDFRDIAGSALVESAAAYLRTQLNVRLGEVPEQMNGEIVSGDYFRAAGVVPVLGRPLTPADDLDGAPPAALASFAIWETRFRRDASILGSTVWIDGVAFTIVGVMPEGYQGMLLDWYPHSAFWLPLRQLPRMLPNFRTLDYEHHRATQIFMMLARLRPGAAVAQFQAALDVLAPRAAASPDLRFVALPALEARFFPAYRDATVRFVWMLMVVTSVALAVACFNLAMLLLARAEVRRPEIAARRAIGATPFRLFQQFAIENLILASCSCALSLPLALAITEWMRGVPVIRGLPISMDMSLDTRALGLAIAAGLASGLCATCFSVSPFRAAARRRAFGRNAFVAAQAACAMTLLVGAGLLARSMHDLRAAPLGFDPRGVLLASLDLYSANVPRDEADRLVRSLLGEVRAQAPEAAITMDDVIPTAMRATLDVAAGADAGAGRWRPLAFNRVSDGYFELLRIPVLSGRAIVPHDDQRSQPIAILNESAAKLLWPGQNPLGRTLRIRGEPADREVVGVVRDMRYRPISVREAATPLLFLPLLQQYGRLGGLTLHVRTPGEPLGFVPSLRQLAARIEKSAPLYGIETMQEHVDSGLAQMRAAAEATAAVSVLSLILALAGIFAAIAYQVAQRRTEIAVRIAVGAEPKRVLGRFAVRGISAAAAGVAVGVAPAAWVAAMLRASIQGVGAPGLLLFALAAVALTLAGAIAAWAAARRIARIQPADLLRAP